MNGEFVMLRRSDLDCILRDVAMLAANEAIRLFGKQASNSELSLEREDELWNAKQVGEYLKVSEFTIQNKWSHQRGVPHAKTVGGGDKPRRRWVASEVIEWGKSQ